MMTLCVCIYIKIFIASCCDCCFVSENISLPASQNHPLLTLLFWAHAWLELQNFTWRLSSTTCYFIKTIRTAHYRNGILATGFGSSEIEKDMDAHCHSSHSKSDVMKLLVLYCCLHWGKDVANLEVRLVVCALSFNSTHRLLIEPSGAMGTCYKR